MTTVLQSSLRLAEKFKKQKNSLFTLIITMLILFARAIITSTVRASAVFPSSYRNMISTNQRMYF